MAMCTSSKKKFLIWGIISILFFVLVLYIVVGVCLIWNKTTTVEQPGFSIVQGTTTGNLGLGMVQGVTIRNPVLGALKDIGNWGQYDTVWTHSFAYEINGKHYLYSQNETAFPIDKQWCIRELKLSSSGHINLMNSTTISHEIQIYPVIFPYSIKGKQYFYSHDPISKKWSTRELLAGGKMGPEIEYGNWNRSYHAGFPFKIGERQYFYMQNFDKNKNWFIHQLLPDGKMGRETDEGHWSGAYSVVFPFSIDGKQYFYGHDPINKSWFIHKLLENGRMGEMTSNWTWTGCDSHKWAFPFTIGGKTFFFGHGSKECNNAWSIRELVLDGQMGEQKSEGTFEEEYQVLVPFSIGGKQYFYAYSPVNGHYFTQDLLS